MSISIYRYPPSPRQDQGYAGSGAVGHRPVGMRKGVRPATHRDRHQDLSRDEVITASDATCVVLQAGLKMIVIFFYKFCI